MGTIQMLDCTLRDGGYCNDCRFGLGNQRRITAGLARAGVEIIECGFLMDRVLYHPDVTRFTSPEQIGAILPGAGGEAGPQYVALADFGRYDFDRLPPRSETPIQGIRVAFHKKDWPRALEACRIVRDKGYRVFVQPMVTAGYTDREFLDLLAGVNLLEPYAFYLVDSFGTLQRPGLLRLFALADHNLAPGIRIGFHPHNNLQLAFSNAQALAELHSSRDLIVDCSVYGMGRGAGNLNTELFARYPQRTAGGPLPAGPAAGHSGRGGAGLLPAEPLGLYGGLLPDRLPPGPPRLRQLFGTAGVPVGPGDGRDSGGAGPGPEACL